MLTVTPNAVAVIKRITQEPEVPPGTGLRIAAQPEGLGVALMPAPEHNDQVLEDNGARLFLEPTAAATLDDMTLDAQVESSGRVQFLLAPTGV